MNPLASFAFLINTAQSLVDAVRARDNVYLRPAMARKAVAERLRSGLIVLRHFLRRLIILIALDLEWGLVDTRGPMKRPHKRKSKSGAAFTLGGLDPDKPSPWLNAAGPQFRPIVRTGYQGPVEVDMAKLYAQLEFLAAIAKDPAAKAKRFAFYLARRHPGILMAPEGPKRIAGRWGTEVRASFDAMAMAIITKSRVRPPPLPPPRTHWPTVIAL
jgi:hypothetical protein